MSVMSPLPLVERLSESGTTALGPAALLGIAMASRQPGSKVCLDNTQVFFVDLSIQFLYISELLFLLILKVIICTDGKANTDLGNLEVEDNDSRTLLSSTIFYQDLGEYAANEGWVSHCRKENSQISVGCI